MTGSVAGHDGGVSRVRLLDAWYDIRKRASELRHDPRGGIVAGLTLPAES
jgi:hypothetical protein